MLQIRKFTIYCSFRYITFRNWLYIYPYRYFYANPSLALLNFRIYKVNGLFRSGGMRENRILITRDKLDIGDNVKYLKLDERIYYALKIK